MEVLKLRSMSPPTLLFFKISLAILSPLHLYVNFRISLSIRAKMAAGILIRIACTESVDQSGEYYHLGNSKFFDL